MKFSFDAQNYRDNLAKDLVGKKKESKEEARQLLNEAVKSDEYVLAKDIKNISDKIIKESVRITPESKEIEKRDINDEFEIQTLDISDSIPKNVQVYFDRIRLKQIKKEKGDYHVDGDYLIADKIFQNEHMGRYEEFQENHQGKFTEREKQELQEEIWNIGQNFEKYLGKINKSALDFTNEITGGALFDPKMLIHVVEGETKNKELESEKRFPHIDKDSNDLTENKFKTDKASISRLWFSANGPSDQWYKPSSVVIIANSEGERMEESMLQIGSWSHKGNELPWYQEEMSKSERLAMATEYAARNKGGGICIDFNENKSWEEIADWIVDLYHGRLYKISKKVEGAENFEKKWLLTKINNQKKESSEDIQNFNIVKVDPQKTLFLEKNLNDAVFKLTEENKSLLFPSDDEIKDEKFFLARREKNKITKKQKFADIFDCRSEQVALSVFEINNQTLVLGENFLCSGLNEQYDGLKYIIGDIDINNPDFFRELEYIAGDCYCWGKKLPTKLQRIGGDLRIKGGEGEKFPTSLKYIGGDLKIDENKIKLPDDIQNIVKGKIIQG